METGPQRRVSSNRLEVRDQTQDPWVKGEWFIHYTMVVPSARVNFIGNALFTSALVDLIGNALFTSARVNLIGNVLFIG